MITASLDNKINKIKKFLSFINSGHSPSTACMLTPISTDALFAFQKLGILEKNDGRWKFIKPLTAIDEDTVKLMAMERWYIKRDNKQQIPEKSDVLTPMPAISQTEEISKLLAKLGDVIGYQFNGKTPPGIWQRYSTIENENRQLKAKVKELESDLESIINLRNKHFKKQSD